MLPLDVEEEKERWITLMPKLDRHHPSWFREVDDYVCEVVSLSSWRVHEIEKVKLGRPYGSTEGDEVLVEDEGDEVLVEEAMQLGLFEPTVHAVARTGNQIGLLDFLLAHAQVASERHKYDRRSNDEFVWERTHPCPWLLAAYVCGREGHLPLVLRWLEFLPNDEMRYDWKGYHVAQLAYNVWKLLMESSTPFEQYEKKLHDIVQMAARFTMVHLAAANGDENSMKSLVAKNRDPTEQTLQLCLTPLHLAACNGHAGIIRLLLEQESSKAKLNAKDRFLGRSAIHFAAEHGYLSIVELLIPCVDMDVDAMDYQGVTPLHLAAWGGHIQIVQCLLSTKKCNINRRVTKKCNMSWRAILGTEWPYFYEIALLDLPPLNYIGVIPTLFPEGSQALHFAIANGHVEVSQVIMEQQTSVSSNNINTQVVAGLNILDWEKLAKATSRQPIGDNKEQDIHPFSILFKRAREEQQFYKYMHKLYRSLMDPDLYEVSMDLAISVPVVPEGKEDDYMQQQLWERLMQRIMTKEDDYMQQQFWELLMQIIMTKRLRWSRFEKEKLVLTLVRTKAILKKSQLQAMFREALVNRMPALAMELLKQGYHCDVVGETNIVNGKTLLMYASSDASWVRREMPEVLSTMESLPDVRRQLYEDRQVYVDYANTLLVGAVLIAGLAFQGWLQPPRGFEGGRLDTEPGGVMRIFEVSTILGFCTAMGTVLVGANGAMPLQSGQLAAAKDKAHRAVVAASILLVLSVACVATSFFAAAIAVLPHHRLSSRITTSTTLSLGAVLLFISCYWFLLRVESLTGAVRLRRLTEPLRRALRRLTDAILRLRDITLWLASLCLVYAPIPSLQQIEMILCCTFRMVCFPILFLAYLATLYCSTRPCVQKPAILCYIIIVCIIQTTIMGCFLCIRGIASMLHHCFLRFAEALEDMEVREYLFFISWMGPADYIDWKMLESSFFFRQSIPALRRAIELLRRRGVQQERQQVRRDQEQPNVHDEMNDSDAVMPESEL